LAEQANHNHNAEADKLFDDAYAKFEAALRVERDMLEALCEWGITLLEHAKTKTGEEVQALYAIARERLLEAEGVMPGSGSYNLACIASLCGQPEACRHWLALCAEKEQLPVREHIDQDSDLDPVRVLDWFKDITQGD
jgi:hypothetical protein